MTCTNLHLCAAHHAKMSKEARAYARQLYLAKRKPEARIARACAKTHARWARELTELADILRATAAQLRNPHNTFPSDRAIASAAGR
jgi:hypothetical protein